MTETLDEIKQKIDSMPRSQVCLSLVANGLAEIIQTKPDLTLDQANDIIKYAMAAAAASLIETQIREGTKLLREKHPDWEPGRVACKLAIALYETALEIRRDDTQHFVNLLEVLVFKGKGAK